MKGNGLDSPVPAMGEEVESARRQVIIERLTFWLLFGVILGLLPMVIGAVAGVMSKNGVDFQTLFAKGDVLVSSAAISGGATGEILFAKVPERHRLFKGTLGFFSIMFCLCNAIAYTQIGASSPGTITAISLIFFVSTLMVSAVCVGMAAGR